MDGYGILSGGGRLKLPSKQTKIFLNLRNNLITNPLNIFLTRNKIEEPGLCIASQYPRRMELGLGKYSKSVVAYALEIKVKSD